MTHAMLQQLIEGKWQNPDTGLPYKIPIQDIKIGRNIIPYAVGKIRAEWDKARILLVCDEHTYPALGRTLAEMLSCTAHILPGNVKASSFTANETTALSQTADILVAVGSGTINDLCKTAAFRQTIPFITFGTAASMNGYASANASLLNEYNMVTSIPAAPPIAIYLDTEILATAPKRMTAAGFADTLCRATTQPDWLLSHLLLDTPYLEGPFTLLKEHEKTLLRMASKIARHDDDALKVLAEALILGGIGMLLAEGSYPASQGEHMIAHAMHMMGKHNSSSLHGEEIAVTSLIMAEHQQQLLQTQHIMLNPNLWSDALLLEYFLHDTVRKCKESVQQKLADTAIKSLNDRLALLWDEMARKIAPYTISPKKLYTALHTAGAPTSTQEIGWQTDDVSDAMQLAPHIRNRFTFLDLAVKPTKG